MRLSISKLPVRLVVSVICKFTSFCSKRKIRRLVYDFLIRGRESQMCDSTLASLSCFSKMLKPAVFFVEDSIPKFGSIAQALSRGRWAIAHSNNNLKVLHTVSIYINVH